MNKPRSSGVDRCSAFARAEEIDPIGSAGSYESVVLVEWPMPWPRDAGDIKEVTELVGSLGLPGRVRTQLVTTSTPTSGAAEQRVVAHLREPDAPFARFERRRLRDPGLAGETEPHRDVLLCAHGTRDICCGSLGTRLFLGRPALGDDTAVWRSSHLGGHRFAPTALLLPEGTSWAYLDADILAAIVHRELPVENAAPHYRGCIGLDGREVQAIDREGLLRHGWSWLDAQRRGEVIHRDDLAATVRLEYVLADRTRGAYEATVAVERMLPVPVCGEPPAPGGKEEPELVVTSLVDGPRG